MRALTVVALVLVMVFAIGPVLWTVGESLKPASAVFSGSWVFRPTGQNYRTVFSSGYPESLIHSAIIDCGAMLLSMALALPAAFAVVRQRKRRLFGAMMDYNYISRLLPGLIILLPVFEVFRVLGLLNSYVGMVLCYQVIGLPVAMATMFGFFAEVPVEIEEAAVVDGATTFGVFTRVALPLVRSGAVATAVMVFVMTWTEFLFALVLTGPQTVTAPVAILNFLKYSNVDWGALAGATVILLVPSVLFGMATSRLFVRGLTSGALK
jgi:multiple sugar transport system permease protein